jgi:hypothetical protein
MAKNSTHYIDNKEFFKAMSEWKTLVIEAENVGDIRPPVSDYIGECFLKIAEHLAFKPNFMNYAYKDDMIGDGIENCLMYAHNFDPEKSKNPFSYFTQIIYYAFLRRIEKEKKQSYIKFKCIKDQDKDGILRNYYHDNYFENTDVEKNDDQVVRGYFGLTEKDIKKFTPKKKKKKSKKSSLDDVLKGKKSEDSTDK